MAAAGGPARGAVLAALAAALLFGAAAPLLKPLSERLPPLLLAGLLYAGAALAVAPVACGRARLAALDARNARRLAGAVLAGGVLAPVLMLLALRFASAAAVALLLSLEVAATALLGALVFRDPLGRRGWLGVAAAVAAGVLLAWGGGVPGTIAALLVGAACLGWGLDNHLTALIDALPPAGTAFAKGVVAGTTNLLLAAWLTPAWPSLADAAAALAVGGACYGASIALYVHAAQRLGAVRAQALFATAPFWGVALAAALRGDHLGVAAVVATALAATAAVLILRDQHAHPHQHQAVAHAHRHRHDDGHHDHPHPALPAAVEHTHPHVHEAVEHSHRHVPDLHHRHRHGIHE